MKKINTFVNNAFRIYKKEITLQLRDKSSIVNQFLFVVSATVMVEFAIGSTTIDDRHLSVFFWLIIFFCGFTGQSDIFSREYERGNYVYLSMYYKPLEVFYGKYFFNISMMLLIELIVTVLFIFFSNMVIYKYIYIISIFILGGIALSLALTTTGAIVANLKNRSAIYPVISLPLILTLLVVLIDATSTAFLMEEDVDNRVFLFLGSYTIALFVLTNLLFEYIWHEK